MSEAVSALAGEAAVTVGKLTLRDRGLTGMVTLRGALEDTGPVAARIAGVAVPGVNRVEMAGGRGLVWMSPDEWLLVLPYGEAGAVVAEIGAALAGVHHLAVDVSDARAVIGLEGPGAREVLGKLAPVDLNPAAFGPGQVRRTRLGQVAAAFWCEAEDRWTVVCFRSVGEYTFRLLAQSARDGAVGFY
jgi:sarcosine oxidase subunit gamma